MTVIVSSLIIGIAVFSAGYYGVPAEKRVSLVCLVAGIIIVLFSAVNLGKGLIIESLVEEIDLGQVSLLGQKNFRAQVQIIYKDGKLDSVVLIPKTTVPEVVATK